MEMKMSAPVFWVIEFCWPKKILAEAYIYETGTYRLSEYAIDTQKGGVCHLEVKGDEPYIYSTFDTCLRRCIEINKQWTRETITDAERRAKILSQMTEENFEELKNSKE